MEAQQSAQFIEPDANSEPPRVAPGQRDPAPDADIEDLVRLNRRGRALRPDGNMLSWREKALVRDHQDMIRDGLGQLSVERAARAEEAREERLRIWVPKDRRAANESAAGEPVEEVVGERVEKPPTGPSVGPIRGEPPEEGLPAAGGVAAAEPEPEPSEAPQGAVGAAEAERGAERVVSLDELMEEPVEPTGPSEPGEYVGRHRLENSQLARPDNVSPELWARFWSTLSDNERRRYLPLVPGGMLMMPPAGAEARHFSQRRGIGRVAAVGAATGWVSDRVYRHFGGPEHKGRRRVAAIAVGAVALAGAAVLTYLAVRHGTEHYPPGVTPHPTPSGSPTPGAPTHPSGETMRPVSLSLTRARDTIWGQVVDYAKAQGVKLSEAQKMRIVGDVLKTNHLTWLQARHLPVGYKVTLSPSQLAEIQNAE